MGGEEWNSHEIVKLTILTIIDNMPRSKIVQKFKDDPKCSNRSISAIEHKQREHNLERVRQKLITREQEQKEELEELREEKEEQIDSLKKKLESFEKQNNLSLKKTIEELEELKEEQEDQIEEQKESLLNVNSKMSKIAYNYNEAIAYQIETNNSLKDENISLKDENVSANKENVSLKKEIVSANKKIVSLEKEVLLVSKIRDSKVIIIPSYLIYICFLLYFIHSFFHYFMK